MDAFSMLAGWETDPVSVAVVDSTGATQTSGAPDRSYPLASVTKILSALAVLVGTEEGLVALDDPCGPPGCTVRHLLAHAGGLAPDQRRLITEPGTRRIYSNAGFELLADTVAERASMPFAEYLREAVCEPLGLAATHLAGSAAHEAHSTAADLAALTWELLRPDPRLIARETRMAAVSAQFAEVPGVLPGFGSQRPNPWGLGLEIRGRKSPHWTGANNAPSTFGHFGRSGTFLWVDPAAGVGCVALTTREFGEWAAQQWPAFSDAILRQF